MTDPGIEFLEKTRYPDFSTVDLILRVPEPQRELPVPDDARVIKLPNPQRVKIRDVPVREALEKWEPPRFFSRSSITLKELSFLLWCTQGVRKTERNTLMLRNVPSSGCRYPIETFLWPVKSRVLRPGSTVTSLFRIRSSLNGWIRNSPLPWAPPV